MDENELLIIEEIVKYCINDEKLYKIGIHTKEKIDKHKNYSDRIKTNVWASFINIVVKNYKEKYGVYNKIIPSQLPEDVRIGAAIRMRQIFEDKELIEIDEQLNKKYEKCKC